MLSKPRRRNYFFDLIKTRLKLAFYSLKDGLKGVAKVLADDINERWENPMEKANALNYVYFSFGVMLLSYTFKIPVGAMDLGGDTSKREDHGGVM